MRLHCCFCQINRPKCKMLKFLQFKQSCSISQQQYVDQIAKSTLETTIIGFFISLKLKVLTGRFYLKMCFIASWLESFTLIIVTTVVFFYGNNKGTYAHVAVSKQGPHSVKSRQILAVSVSKNLKCNGYKKDTVNLGFYLVYSQVNLCFCLLMYICFLQWCFQAAKGKNYNSSRDSTFHLLPTKSI